MPIEELLKFTSFQVKVSIFTELFFVEYHQTLVGYSTQHPYAILSLNGSTTILRYLIKDCITVGYPNSFLSLAPHFFKSHP